MEVAFSPDAKHIASGGSVVTVQIWNPEIGKIEQTLRRTHPGTEQTRPTLFSTTKGTGHSLHVCKGESTK
jgi:hypothetical protein